VIVIIISLSIPPIPYMLIRANKHIVELIGTSDIVIAGSVFVNMIKNEGIGKVESFIRALL